MKTAAGKYNQPTESMNMELETHHPFSTTSWNREVLQLASCYFKSFGIIKVCVPLQLQQRVPPYGCCTYFCYFQGEF